MEKEVVDYCERSIELRKNCSGDENKVFTPIKDSIILTKSPHISANYVLINSLLLSLSNLRNYSTDLVLCLNIYGRAIISLESLR